MPELPEIETVKLQLQKIIVGLRIEKVEVLNAPTVHGKPELLEGKKVAEGKNKMSVINAVRNKLVLRMFAVIREDRLYERGKKLELVKS